MSTPPTETWKPTVYDPSVAAERAELESLQSSGEVMESIDALPEAIEDLFRIDFPYIAPGSPEFAATFVQYQEFYLAGRAPEQTGRYVHFPWKRCLIHLPDAAGYYKLRTARNKFLILPEEQDAFSAARVGVAGLSVGSSAVNSLILSGGAGRLRIADHDTLAITNLNRLLGSVCDLGRSKAVMAARRAYELNPYLELEIFPEGLDDASSISFLGTGDGKLDLLVEEVDDIKLKIDLRFKARDLMIPVLMATDNGDNAFLDVERFDLDPDRPLFHGLVAEEVLSTVPANPSPLEKVRLAGTIVGFDITPRTQSSLMSVGSRLPSWPQLGNAATLSGILVSYAARRILSGLPLPSGRYSMSFDELLDPGYHTAEGSAARAADRENFVSGFTLLYGKEQS